MHNGSSSATPAGAVRPPPTLRPATTRPAAAPPEPIPILLAPRCFRRSPQLVMQVREGLGQDRLVPAPLHREPERPVERWKIAVAEALGLPFPEPDPSYPPAVLHLVVQRGGVAPEAHHGRQRLQSAAGRLVHQ